MSDDEMHWSTAITEVKPNELRLRGYRLDELMGRISFAAGVYLALTGELPAPGVERLLDAMLLASIDHGATPPSALAARTTASTGAPLNAAVAAGVLSINRHHGGAIEDCMGVIQEALALAAEQSLSIAEAAAALVAAYRAQKKRMAGLGHRIHTDDPRTARLFALAAETGTAGDGVKMLQALAAAFAVASGRALPVNVDGAIAALLVDLGLPPALANAFFIMARVPGLVAHVYEEQTRERPMRRIHPSDHDYDGPPARDLPE
ncbi:MAG: citryl-CoA lyase [Anaerolineae bacterium]|nr:citryl-CoA lyase [Anaerolineae bacterium]